MPGEDQCDRIEIAKQVSRISATVGAASQEAAIANDKARMRRAAEWAASASVHTRAGRAVKKAAEETSSVLRPVGHASLS